MNITRWSAVVLLGLGYVIALNRGELHSQALIPIGLLVLAGIAVQPARSALTRWLGHALFIATGVALAAHWLPGFANAPIMELGQSSAQAVPFKTWMNLDKPLIGLWILLACPWVLHHGTHNPGKAGTVILATVISVLALAWVLGVTAWAPKWPPYATLWLVNNLLLVTLTEELLFRGYLQHLLQHVCHHFRLGGILPLAITALLFGLAHLSGGWPWVLLASLAGIGYGLAWRFGGLWAAVLAHFGLNLVHFCLFAYPMLAK